MNKELINHFKLLDSIGVKKQFNLLKKEIKKLENIEFNPTPGKTESELQIKKYYEVREKFIKQFKMYLYCNYKLLNKSQFIELCEYISKYRPVEPWQFLVQLSINPNPKKVK